MSLESVKQQFKKQYDYVYPAAGAPNAAVKVTLKELLQITNEQWVDVCK